MLNKHTIAMSIITACVIICTGCGYTVEEQSEHKRIETQGNNECIKYVDDKYGFEPEIISTNVLKDKQSDSFTPDATGELICTCKYDDDIFYVYIPNINDDKKTIADTYQEKDVIEYVSKSVSEYLKIDEADIYAKVVYNQEDDRHNYLSSYFTDLTVFNDQDYYLYLGLVDVDPNVISMDFKSYMNFYGAQITIFDDSTEAYKWYADPGYEIKSNTTHLIGYVEFMNKYYNGKHSDLLVTQQYDYSMCENVKFNQPNIKINKVEPYVDSSRLVDAGYIDAKYATDFYLIDNESLSKDTSVMQISVKLSDIGLTDTDKNVYSFIAFHELNGYNEIQHVFTRLSGDELIGTIHIYDDSTRQSFAIIKEAKNGYYNNK